MTVCSNMTFRKKNLDCKHAATVVYYHSLCLPGMGEGSCIAFGVADARRRRAAGRWGTPSGGWPVAAVEHASLLVVASPTSNTEFHLKINGKLHFLKNFF